ncbi:MAG: KH domain-containing protein [bacterium]|nr:KH domain-containing protein [bacterium]
MKELISFIVSNIVNNKESVNVSETDQSPTNSKTILIKVAKEDMGIIIGKMGKTINSIRNIAKAKSIKDNTFVDIQIKES